MYHQKTLIGKHNFLGNTEINIEDNYMRKINSIKIIPIKVIVKQIIYARVKLIIYYI